MKKKIEKDSPHILVEEANDLAKMMDKKKKKRDGGESALDGDFQGFPSVPKPEFSELEIQMIAKTEEKKKKLEEKHEQATDILELIKESTGYFGPAKKSKTRPRDLDSTRRNSYQDKRDGHRTPSVHSKDAA